MCVYFASKLPTKPVNIIDLSGNLEISSIAVTKGKLISLTPFFIENESKWKESFIDALGAVNKNNASLGWWAYTVSSKNFLSSNLGKEIFQVLAIQRFLCSDKSGLPLVVLGASIEQKSFFGYSKLNLFSRIAYISKAFARNIYHALRCLFFLKKSMHQAKLDVIFISYALKAYKWKEDIFFGSLIGDISEKYSNLSIKAYLYVNASFNKAKSFCEDVKQVELLFYHLKLVDIVTSFFRTALVLFELRHLNSKLIVSDINFSPLLVKSLLDDISSGKYFFNLLVYKATGRMVQATSVKRIIYPYENKSLEKMILMAARSVNSSITCIGYQHSSVTPRHTTLLFSKGESESTPLPDKIITLGIETKEYLEKNGNYPENIFIEGCSLRQKFPNVLPEHRKKDDTLRVLLALSSSKNELLEAIHFCREANNIMPEICFGIRSHPEFPLYMLPQNDIDWIKSNAKDFSGSGLEDNILWADMCVYVSSTVALEAMLYGVPVVNMRLSDVIDPDPVLKQVNGVWKASTAQELASFLDNWMSLDALQQKDISQQVTKYAQRYFLAPTDTCINTFIDG